jgi:D-lactate dehydrogenase
MSYDVFCFEAFDEEQQMLRECMPEQVRAGYTWKTIQEAGDREPPAPLISVRTQSTIPVEWAGRLAGILTRSTGFDHVQSYRRRCGTNVPAGYLPLYCNRSVAEQAMLLWMALLRRLPRQMAHFAAFQRDDLTGRECFGKTLLSVGVGNIGSEVIRIASGLGMTALGVDLVERHDFVEYVAYEEGAPQADIVVCAMNLTAENRGYFHADRLRLAKPGVLLVNIARGELVPPADLLELLREGHVAGAGLDVYDEEAELAVALREGRLSVADASHPDPSVAATLALARRPDVIVLPHNAFNTVEAVERKAQQSVDALQSFVSGGQFTHPVPPVAAG